MPFCKLTFCGLNYSKLISTGAGQCDSPFGMEDGSIGDNNIIATSSSNESSRASQARLNLRNDNSTAGAWCAAQNKVVSHASFWPEWYSNPTLCDTGAVLHQLNFQANWELVVR